MTLYERLSAMTALVIRAARRLSCRRHATRAEFVLTRPQGHEPIRVPIAGVRHRDHSRSVRRLTLGAPLRLRREFGNAFDPNAISVETRTGHPLGYVGRSIAAKLAPYMDARKGPLDAVVTQLACDIDASAVGVAATFYLPDTLAADLRREAQGWEFCCDPPVDGIAYLMLNCDEADLTRVKQALEQAGLKPDGWGGPRLASDGRSYRWYVRLKGRPESDRIRQLLNETLGADRRVVRETEYSEVFDEELADAARENVRLRAEASALRQENVSLTERMLELERVVNPTRRGTRTLGARDLDIVIRSLLPGVTLLRDSLEEMAGNLEGNEPALHDLRTLRWEAKFPAKATIVAVAPAWRESRFRTGHQKVGRLYFRKRNGEWTVLVSSKGNQDPRDIDYLKEH